MHIKSSLIVTTTIAILFSSLVTTAGFPTTARVLAYESSQAGSLANTCGNADQGAFNILCQNLFSEIQGDGNAVNIIGLQTGGERTTSPPPTTGTLKVIKQVECPAGITCPDPSDFGMEVTGNNPNPATFDGSSSGTDVDIGTGRYSVDETVPTLPSGQTLTTTKSADCSGTINAGESKTCTVTNTLDTEDIVTEVNGQGNPASTACGVAAPQPVQAISFSATGTGGSINSGQFSLVFNPTQSWIGSISGGTFSTTSYQLTGQVVGGVIGACNSAGGGTVPQLGDTFIISGNCGNNVAIEFSMSNGQIRGTFTGNVQCGNAVR
jgi:hypothetical protein